MELLDPTKLWFNTPDSSTLCRGGGNGPNHPSQLYGLQYLSDDVKTFLDYGCGSGTTYEALLKKFEGIPFYYRGLDIIPKNIDWLKNQWPAGDWKVNTKIHEIDEPDQSWDVVYSRHVVDHMDSFEHGMDEHCRVSKKFVIVVLWRPLGSGEDHEIKHIKDQGKTYEDEYTNDYSKRKVLEYLGEKEEQGWKIVDIAEDVGSEVSGHDVVIVLEKI